MQRAATSFRLPVLITAFSIFLSMAAGARAGTILSDNLSAASAGTETATADTLLAGSFGTDGSSYILDSVTLLMARTSITGQVELSLYSDGGLQPGSLVGTLAGPSTISSDLSDVTFTGAGLSLSANSTYWVVLTALTGSFDWSWTDSDTGSGAGFQDAWGFSPDAGATWFPYFSTPVQFQVVGTAVPEPGSLVLLSLSGGTLLAAALAARRRRSL